jgi:N-methylhydantoinase B
MVNVDPITLEVVTEGMIAIVREMRATVTRTAYSSAVYELDDFSCGLFAPDGELVAQFNDIPSHVIPAPWGVRCTMDDFGDDIHPGDIFILNDSYRGGTHLNDVTILYPVFYNGKLFMLPMVRSHWGDVGGTEPGSYSGEATNIFQEGVRIPPIKLYERGKVNSAALAIILSNMRQPDVRLGDIHSAIGACKIAESRVLKMLEKYGEDVVSECIKLDLDRSEKRLRDRIAKLPDGQYVYEDYLEYFDDGVFDPVLMRVTLTIDGDNLTADFAGSNPQVPGPVNTSLAVAGAGIFVGVKATLDAGGTVNGGLFRPLHFKAPEASIVDVRPDAPAGAHAEVRKRAVSVALGALAQVIPDLVSGDLCGTSFPNNMGGFSKRRGRTWAYLEVPAGGNGGLKTTDGSSAFVNVDHGNVRSILTAEVLEQDIPFMVTSCELRTDSGGEGESRGGLGMRRELQLVEDEARYSVLSDRAVIPPYGMGMGAHASAQVRARLVVNGETRALRNPGKVTGVGLKRGHSVIMESAGGGGYGDPLRRAPDKVKQDVDAGYVSVERARERYGVCLLASGDIDHAATEMQRHKLRKERIFLPIEADESDQFEGWRGRHRVLRISRALADRLNVADADLVELKGKNPAPLRAWIRIAPERTGEQVPMDEFGRRVLGLKPGEAALFRKLEMPPLRLGMSGFVPREGAHSENS